MSPALYAEALKLRRSGLPWITVLAITIGAATGGLFMFVSLHPDTARDLGLLGAKAQLTTLDPTWDSYLGLLAQIAAVGGTLIFGIVVIWVFGREFADHTAKDLLALPTTRAAVVTAKFTAAAAWCLALTGYLTVLGLGIGVALDIPGPATVTTVSGGVLRIAITAVLTIALTTLFGWAASVGRGYLPAVGVMFAVVFTAQIVAALGYGAWFPFSVPALHAGIAGAEHAGPAAVGYAGLAVVAILSVAATVRWWVRADHTH